MIGRILAVGLLAGVLGGLATSAVQHATTVPLILAAEVYEKAAEKAETHHSSLRKFDGASVLLAHDHDAVAPKAATEGKPAEWEPADGLERTAYTTLATVGAAVGFAMMLLAAMLASGAEITPRSATLWGVAGFIATGLAPALGLPPELPGAASADLIARQVWWAATALSTGAGIWLLFRSTSALWRGFGPVLIVAPHLIGAPHIAAFKSTVPAEIAGHFTAASLVVHAVLWVLVAAALGALWRLAEQRGRSPAATRA